MTRLRRLTHHQKAVIKRYIGYGLLPVGLLLLLAALPGWIWMTVAGMGLAWLGVLLLREG